jgi:O-antigen/teichoic acid export membrane protein
MFAQYGRDRSRLQSLMGNATRYVWLIAVPVFLGLAAIASPLIMTVYGAKYVAVIPVLVVLSVFSLPRAFQPHSESLLQATEAQGFMVRWLTVCAVINISLDFALIPTHGAIGAAVANGLAQTLAVLGVWIKGSAALRLTPPFQFLAHVTLAGLVMMAAVIGLTRVAPAALGLFGGVALGVLVFGAAVRVTGCLNPTDVVRFEGASRKLPRAMQPAWRGLLRLLAPAAGVVQA